MPAVYTIARPLASHWRRASCAEVDCEQWQRGWVVVLDPAAPAYRDLRRAIDASGRRYRLTTTDAVNAERGMVLPPGLEAAEFAPGQPCFREHLLPLDREPLYIPRASGRTWTHSSWASWSAAYNDAAVTARRLLGHG